MKWRCRASAAADADGDSAHGGAVLGKGAAQIAGSQNGDPASAEKAQIAGPAARYAPFAGGDIPAFAEAASAFP